MIQEVAPNYDAPVEYCQLMTAEEFFDWHRPSDLRYELIGGMLYAQDGASQNHSQLIAQLSWWFVGAARGTGCRVLAATSSFRISQDTVYVPDLAVRCDPEDNDPLYIARPCIVVEILSPSTESIDQREKAAAYRGIDSLLAYLIFSQDAMRVVRHWRETTSDPWQVMIHHRGDVPIPCMDAQLPLAEVYANILPPEEESSGGSAEEEQGDDRAEERHGR